MMIHPPMLMTADTSVGWQNEKPSSLRRMNSMGDQGTAKDPNTPVRRGMKVMSKAMREKYFAAPIENPKRQPSLSGAVERRLARRRMSLGDPDAMSLSSSTHSPISISSSSQPPADPPPTISDADHKLGSIMSDSLKKSRSGRSLSTNKMTRPSSTSDLRKRDTPKPASQRSIREQSRPTLQSKSLSARSFRDTNSTSDVKPKRRALKNSAPKVLDDLAIVPFRGESQQASPRAGRNQIQNGMHEATQARINRLFQDKSTNSPRRTCCSLDVDLLGGDQINDDDKSCSRSIRRRSSSRSRRATLGRSGSLSELNDERRRRRSESGNRRMGDDGLSSSEHGPRRGSRERRKSLRGGLDSSNHSTSSGRRDRRMSANGVSSSSDHCSTKSESWRASMTSSGMHRRRRAGRREDVVLDRTSSHKSMDPDVGEAYSKLALELEMYTTTNPSAEYEK